ncbi:MAG: site-specific integrase [Ferruginibacter sp.]
MKNNIYTTTDSMARPKFMLYSKRRSKSQDIATIYVRITLGILSLEKSTGITLSFKDWDSSNHVIKNNPYHQKQLTEIVEAIREKTMGAFHLLKQSETEATLREIMDLAFRDEGKRMYSLFGLFNDYICKMEKTNRLPRQQSNILKHHTCLRHLKAFVKDKFNISDVSFTRINRSFIDDFEMFLKTDCNNGHNSTMKLLQIFKKVYKVAVDNRWTNQNAFAGKRLHYEEVDIDVLSEQEITALKEIVLEKNYLEKTRQFFLFSIYTGVSYIDMQSLRRSHIEFNPVSNQYFIRKKREKTLKEFLLPLFAPAQQIIDGWMPGWETTAAETLLAPRISNQKYNVYLKELFALLSIQKRSYSHLGRHVFATTVTYENGVPLETLSKMLGHKKLSQTQRYAKVSTLKIERETRALFEKLAGNVVNAVNAGNVGTVVSNNVYRTDSIMVQ